MLIGIYRTYADRYRYTWIDIKHTHAHSLAETGDSCRPIRIYSKTYSRRERDRRKHAESILEIPIIVLCLARRDDHNNSWPPIK